MIGNLNTALRTLKDAIARDPGAVPVLTREAIETEFHGLNVSQIARLVDAPALGCAETRRSERGAAVELLMQAAGQAEAPAAGRVPAPDQLKRYGLQLLETAQQSEAALAALQQGVDAIIAMLNEAEPLHPQVPQ